MHDNEKVQLVRVLEAHQGQRLDNFLMRLMKGVPRSRVYRLIRRGEVRVNKGRCKPDRRLECGDEIRIPPFSAPPTVAVRKPSPALQELLLNCVLLEDKQLLVLNKPAGLAVHGGSGIRLGLIEAMRQMKPEWASLELAHRLDRDTSGCLVISKNSIFLKHIQRELKAKSVDKHYLALVHGQWPGNLLTMAAPLQKNELHAGERVVRVRESGKPSTTHFTVVERYQQATLVEAMPVTGRTHQIRVHCQYAGYPIVGDAKYSNNSPPALLANIKSLCLHASKIRFTAPGLAAPIEVDAPLDIRFIAILNMLTKTDK